MPAGWRKTEFGIVPGMPKDNDHNATRFLQLCNALFDKCSPDSSLLVFRKNCHRSQAHCLNAVKASDFDGREEDVADDLSYSSLQQETMILEILFDSINNGPFDGPEKTRSFRSRMS